MGRLVSERGSCVTEVWNVLGYRGLRQRLRLETGTRKQSGFVVPAISVVLTGEVRGSWIGKVSEGLEPVRVVVVGLVVQGGVAKNIPIYSMSSWSTGA